MSDNSGVSALVGGAAGAVLGHGLNAVLDGGHVNDGVANNPGDLPGPGDGGLVAVLDGGGGADGGIHTPLGAGVGHSNGSHNTGDGSVAVAGVSLSVGLGLGLSLTLVVAVSSHNSSGGGDNSGTAAVSDHGSGRGNVVSSSVRVDGGRDSGLDEPGGLVDEGGVRGGSLRGLGALGG